jgi:hypothetical protein
LPIFTYFFLSFHRKEQGDLRAVFYTNFRAYRKVGAYGKSWRLRELKKTGLISYVFVKKIAQKVARSSLAHITSARCALPGCGSLLLASAVVSCCAAVEVDAVGEVAQGKDIALPRGWSALSRVLPDASTVDNGREICGTDSMSIKIFSQKQIRQKLAFFCSN